MSQRPHVMQFFKWEHLPNRLQKISKPFGELAETMLASLPNNPEKIKALDRLLEAKDAAVRAEIAGPL